MAMEELMRWITQPDWAKDGIVVDVDIVLSWQDLLLLIWRRGRFSLTVKTWTADGPISGRMESLTKVRIRPVLWPWRQRPIMAVEAGRERGDG